MLSLVNLRKLLYPWVLGVLGHMQVGHASCACAVLQAGQWVLLYDICKLQEFQQTFLYEIVWNFVALL